MKYPSWYIRIALYIAAVIFFTSLAIVECSHSAELGWDGMPVKEKKKDERLNKGWHFLTASGLVLLATVGDVETTFHNIKHHGAKEGNPWAESWFKKGKPTAYAYALGVSGATMFAGWLVFRSKNPDTQKYWIIFPTIAIVGHGIGIGLNLSF